MSKLSRAKTDLKFLKNRIKENWFNKDEIKALQRCAMYCETYIKLLEIKRKRNEHSNTI
jgi:hypothetical protein